MNYVVLFVVRLLNSHFETISSSSSDINKRLPGPHFDPPTKEDVRAMVQVNYVM